MIVSKIRSKIQSWMTEKNIYWTKLFLYATSFIWVIYLAIFFHELGHAITVISLGGTLRAFVVTWDFRGYVMWTWENIPADSIQRVMALVGVSGGIGAALFFLVLTHKTKWFAIPALCCLVDGFGEAMYLADTRANATNGMGLAVLFICLGLVVQFEARETKKWKEKRIARVGPRERRVPEHIYEKAMRALEKCVGNLEEKHDRLRDLEETNNEV